MAKLKLTKEDWAGLWSEFDEWFDNDGLGRTWHQQMRKITSLVNKAIKAKT